MKQYFASVKTKICFNSSVVKMSDNGRVKIQVKSAFYIKCPLFAFFDIREKLSQSIF